MQEQLSKSPYPWDVAFIWSGIGMALGILLTIGILTGLASNPLPKTLSLIEEQAQEESNDLSDGITSVVPTFTRLCKKYPCYGTIVEDEDGNMAFRGLHPDVEWSTDCKPIPGELNVDSQVVVYGPVSQTGNEHRITPVRCPIPTISLRPTVEYHYHEVAPGDWLSKIAQEYLGDANRWPEIWEWNRGVVGGSPHLIFPGTEIQIQYHHPENEVVIMTN